VAKCSDLRISAKVCTHIGRNGSSIESATAMNARMIGSESGTVPEPAASCGLRRWEPTATIARMSFMTCSFSTACLLSRANDLGRSIRLLNRRAAINGLLHYIPFERLFSKTFDRVVIDQRMS
jgi:hypothetical protein